MKRTLLVMALVGAVLLCAAPVLADDGFYVIVGGGGVGTKITSLPLEIKNAGFYYLTGNLSYSGAGNGITVSSDQVTIDLMGFRLSGPGGGGSGSSYAIMIAGDKNVEVRNGSLNGWLAGVSDDGSGECNRAFNLRAENCWVGIDFESSGGNLVKGCSADGGNIGISINGGVATGNAVTNCNGTGISGYGTISGNFLTNCGYGISGSGPGTISGNSVNNCSQNGIYCYGASSIIGNTVVNPTSGTPKGINIATPDPVLVTQNTVSGNTPASHFTGGGATINVANTNAGF